MKQKKIAIIMAGILAAAAAMTGCAEQNKQQHRLIIRRTHRGNPNRQNKKQQKNLSRIKNR